MGKAVFLFVIVRLSLILCSESSQNDNLVFDNSSVGGSVLSDYDYEKPVADFINFTSPAFWSSSSLEKNSKCKIHMDIVRQRAGLLDLWALKILDATAKLPSGILSGNLNQFGDFDECLASQGHFDSQEIKGKYCLANINVKLVKNGRPGKIQILDNLIHSHRMLRNELLDQGHRIPKMETFNWGLCIPSSCGAQEIERAFNIHLNHFSKDNLFLIEATISDDVCYVQENREVSTTKLAVQCMFLMMMILIIFGTWIDTKKIILYKVKLTQALHCFSLKKNWSLLLKTNSSDDDLDCIHGARFLNAIALLFSHKQIAMLFNPVTNRTAMSEAMGKPWTMIGRSAILYTDSFILISGLLVSYSTIKDLDTKKKINFKEKLINRIVRFTPNLFCTILFCTYIMDDMGSGPQWGLVVNKYTDLCKKYMWRNFLYIHNYFGFENMCLTHTHQLGIDMQLFWASPIFVYLIWKLPKLGLLILTALSVASTWLRYHITYRENLSTLLYFGISVDRLWRTANMSYILPTHRLSVYLIGILIGYYLRRGGKQLTFSYFQATVGWIIALIMAFTAVFLPYQSAVKEYVYNVEDAAHFNAFAPLLWVGFLSWTLLACLNGYGGLFNDFLSWKYFKVFTKISYAIYLTQFPVFFYNVGVVRSGQYFAGFQSLFDIPELGAILISSVLLTLTFDLPFQELKKTLIRRPKIKQAEVNEESDDHSEMINQDGGGRHVRNRSQYFGT